MCLEPLPAKMMVTGASFSRLLACIFRSASLLPCRPHPNHSVTVLSEHLHPLSSEQVQNADRTKVLQRKHQDRTVTATAPTFARIL